MIAELKQYMDEKFARIEMLTALGAKPILGVEEAAVFTGFTVKGIYTLTSEKRIPHYKRNHRLLFSKEELVKWMTERKILTDDEVRSMAETYTVTRRRMKQ